MVCDVSNYFVAFVRPLCFRDYFLVPLQCPFRWACFCDLLSRLVRGDPNFLNVHRILRLSRCNSLVRAIILWTLKYFCITWKNILCSALLFTSMNGIVPREKDKWAGIALDWFLTKYRTFQECTVKFLKAAFLLRQCRSILSETACEWSERRRDFLFLKYKALLYKYRLTASIVICSQLRASKCTVHAAR